MNKKISISLLLLLAIFVAVELIFGSVQIDFSKVFYQDASVDARIFYHNRIPRVLLAILVGSGSALAGLGIQTIFKNPLAGPTTLGINSGAGLGVALFFLIPGGLGAFNQLGIVMAAVIGSLSFLFLLFSIVQKRLDLTLVLIIGILLSYLSYSIVEVLIQYTNDKGLRSFVFWGMGSLDRGEWNWILLLFIALSSSIVFLIKNISQFNVYLLGDDEMKLLGLSPNRLKKQTIIVLGILVGLITAIVGPIAFVGIVAPNLLKMWLKTVDHRVLIPLTAILGAIMVLIADILARGVFLEIQLPLNAALSILGAPVVIYYLIKKQWHVRD